MNTNIRREIIEVQCEFGVGVNKLLNASRKKQYRTG